MMMIDDDYKEINGIGIYLSLCLLCSTHICCVDDEGGGQVMVEDKECRSCLKKKTGDV